MWPWRVDPLPDPVLTSVVTNPPDDSALMTVDQAKLRAGLEWPAGDPREELLVGYIAAARDRVEKDTGLALLTQGREVHVAWWPPTALLQLPDQCRPLQEVTGITYLDGQGVIQVVNPSLYNVDLPRARIWFTTTVAFTAQPGSIVIAIIAGYTTVTEIPALLLHAHGLLVTHYATTGRDVATPDAAVLVPYGYDDAVAPYRVVTVG